MLISWLIVLVPTVFLDKVMEKERKFPFKNSIMIEERYDYNSKNITPLTVKYFILILKANYFEFLNYY